jgi:hypothetical protein
MAGEMIGLGEGQREDPRMGVELRMKRKICATNL